jgi:hypothetical protein
MSEKISLYCDEDFTDIFNSLDQALQRDDESTDETDVVVVGQKRKLSTPTLFVGSPEVPAVKVSSGVLKKRSVSVPENSMRQHPFFFVKNEPCQPVQGCTASTCYRCFGAATTYCCSCFSLAVCNECMPIDYVHRKLYAIACAHCPKTEPLYAPMIKSRENLSGSTNSVAVRAAHKELVKLLEQIPDSTAFLIAGRVEKILRILVDDTNNKIPE